MVDYKFSCQNKYSSFKEWMTAILTVIKTDTLLQVMDGRN